MLFVSRNSLCINELLKGQVIALPLFGRLGLTATLLAVLLYFEVTEENVLSVLLVVKGDGVGVAVFVLSILLLDNVNEDSLVPVLGLIKEFFGDFAQIEHTCEFLCHNANVLVVTVFAFKIVQSVLVGKVSLLHDEVYHLVDELSESINFYHFL